MQQLPAGAMLSVALAEEQLAPYLGEELGIAALNGPRASVLSGTLDAVAAAEQRLAAQGVATRRLKTSHAFHSSMMQPMLDEFEAAVAKLAPRVPQRPFVSSVTGTWITNAEAQSPAYWSAQCRQPVRFAAALATLLKDSCDTLLEVGPGETLTTLAMQQAASAKAIASLTRASERRPVKTVQDALAVLWTCGVQPGWPAIYANQQRRRIPLPTYPFERKLFWVEPPAKSLTNTYTEAASMPTVVDVPAPAQAVSRAAHLCAEIAAELTAMSGIETTPADFDAQFLELGFDSLFLTQATQSLSKKFGVKLTFRQLMEQFTTIAAVADHLDATLAVEKFQPASKPSPSIDAMPAAPLAVASGSIDQLLATQLAALSEMFAAQVATLRAAASGAPSPLALAPAPKAALPVATPQAEVRFNTIQPKASHELDARQQAYIDALIAKYSTLTAGSKRLTQAGRQHLSDPRAVSGFKPQWKEMVYPLITESARGSRLWDVDGNEFIDIVNGYGCIMFGHSPHFVVDAAMAQLERGVAIGPQSPLAAEVAALICELTGNERATFCNTGSEAVMAAMRVARTITGRDKVVYFAGDYHGTFDEVLVRATPRGTAPVAPGIPVANVTNVIVLDYGTDASLNYIRTHADEIAAVLIEPVQTRHPELKPFDFIRNVRTVTEQTGIAMILDEVVTGFRLAPGGVQQHLGIRADMCTYGKVIGGGHPIGVLSGKAMYLDALDGGMWQFGDDSGPEVGVTFFAGTFVRHPLALAAARAVLTHLKQQGPALQQDLNAKTAKLAESLDAFFIERGVPSRIHHFASWFYFTFPNDARLGSLLYYAMRAKGIHIQEGYPCFLTTAHSDADLAAIENAFRETILDMQAAGILLTKPLEAESVATPASVVLTEPQREIFLAAALNDEANCAFNESLTLDLTGPIREQALEQALAAAFARHDALRSTLSADGETLNIAAHPNFATEFVDIREFDTQLQHAMLADAIAGEARTPFDLTAGPLLRSTRFALADDHAVLLLTAHHIVLDGWSASQLLEDAGRIYSGVPLTPVLPFSRYAQLEQQHAASGDFADNENYWVAKFEGRQPRLDLPTDRPRTPVKTYRGGTFAGSVDATLYTELKKVSTANRCTLNTTLLAAFQTLLHRLSGQAEVVVGISTAGQALHAGTSLVGHCVHFLPILSDVTESLSARDLLRATNTALLDAYDHQEFTYGSLLRKLKLEPPNPAACL